MQRKQRSYANRILATLFVSFIMTVLVSGTALAGEVVYQDDEKHDLNDPNTTYIIRGDGTQHKSGNYFYVSDNSSSAENPLVIVLDNVNRTQAGSDPSNSFITVAANNYVIVKLRGTNTIVGGEQEGVGSNDGMAGIHVSQGATLKVTSEAGDGSTDGSLTVKGGGSKYGGAGIGTSYNHATGGIIIAGGTIDATGGHCAAGIGSGRDGQAYGIQITGGSVTAQGGEYAAGIGAGDNVGSGKGGDTYDITISGGTVNAKGGANGAGIGCSEGGTLRDTILISGGDVNATGGNEGAGIGSGDGAGFAKDDGEKGLVKITGGNIHATGGGNGAGIGGANGADFINVQVDQTEGSELSVTAQGGENGAGIGSGAEDCDNVSIRLRGGSIEAHGGSSGAGIGGANDPGVGTGGKAKVIEIYGTGTVNAYGGSNAAAIGGGYDNEVSDHITIEGDGGGRNLTIVADSGGGTAAGIGSGSEDCGAISIKNANVKAWGDGSAADIGTGGNWGNGGKIPSVTIENCKIETKGTNKTGAGIGAGEGCECKSITIKQSECTGNAIGEGMGVFFFFWSNYGDMDSITIEDSFINATWDNASTSKSMGGSAAAGVGSCTLGCVKTISIKNSNVTAKGIHGGAGIGSGGWGADDYLGLEYVGGEVGSVTIENSTVNATGAEPGVQSNAGSPGPDLTHRPVVGGGAGIGGGGNTRCGTISIKDSEVTAKAGKYAAGIGGGGSESVDAVDISGSTVTTTGGKYGAGIGCGGSDSAVTTTVFHADVDTIKISSSTVTATGGQYAAGIGTGCGGAMDTTTADKKDIDYNIRVTDSTVNAQGGEGGAGIGGGTVGSYATGGHSGDVLLEGASRITATGGKQGSGVGGGASSDFQGHGGCDNVVIDLTTADEMAQDTAGCDERGIGWLVATGGLGAAGIGAGGYLFHYTSHDPIPNTNDTQSIEIKGGYVVATGGADDTDDAGIKTGSGAGIGGGAAGTKLKDLTISGGWVEAYAGNAHAADIGHGGNTSEQDGKDDSSNRFYVSGGTVTTGAGGFGAQASKVFDGGSIRTPQPVSGAHNSAGTPVYKTSLKMRESTMDWVQASVAGIGSTNVYADDESMIYLYLPASDTNAQTSSIKEHPDTAFPLYGDYYGTTTTDGTGWLKMKGERVHFEDEPDWQHYDDEVTLTLYDDEGIAGAKWNQEDIKVTGVAELKEVVKDTSPGMQIKVHVTGVGSYHVEAFSASDASNPLYWGSQASYDMTTIKVNTTINVTSSSSKTYDGTPIEDPSFETNGTGDVTITYRDADSNVLEDKPVEVGSYTATINVAETDVSTSAEAKVNISIWPIQTTTVVSLAENNAQASATATVLGLEHGGTGTVTFVAKKNDQVVATSEPASVLEQANTATVTFDQVVSGEYEVVATFGPSDGNHEGSTDTARGKKGLATRTISGATSYEKTYGDEPFNLGMSVDNSKVTDNDTWTYRVVWDSYAKYGLEPAVEVGNDGLVTIKHAGTSVIKVTLSDVRSVYHDAIALVRVVVGRKQLTVKSFAYLRTDAGKKPVNTVTYGDTPGLSTDLSYDGLASGDAPAAIGTLSAMPLPTILGATAEGAPYAIPILRNDGEVTVRDNSFRVFASRDYAITYEPGTLAVTKRKVAVQALDTSGVYGGEAPEYGWDVASNQQDFSECRGLAPWDSRDAIYTEGPTVALVAGEYKSLNAGTHKGVLRLSDGTSANYEVVPVNGNLVITPAPLSDKGRFRTSVEDTVYNGGEQKQPVAVTDASLQDKQLVQGEDKDYNVTYAGDTTNAGRVWVVVCGHGNYEGFQAVPYRIAKATITVETPSATKRYDGTPLRAQGTVDGILGNDATYQFTGSQTVPGNSRNSYKLEFASDAVAADYRVREDVGVLWVRGNYLARCEMTKPDDVVYDGKEHKAVVKITDGDGKPLREGTDYELTYESTAGNLTDAGTVTVTATGKGVYAIDRICISDEEREVSDEAKKLLCTKSVTYDIRPVKLIVDTEEAKKVYDGTPLTAPGSVEELVGGETATVKTTGSQTEVGSSKNTYELVWDGSAKEGDYQVVHEDLGMLTVTEAESNPTSDVSYVCAQGEGGTWTKGSDTALTFVYKRTEDDAQTFSHFQGIEVDGKEIDHTSYDARSGSLVASLKAEYLEGISVGEHTVRPLFDDGSAQRVSFTVVAASAGSNEANATRPANVVSSTSQTSPTSQATAQRTNTLPRTADSSFGVLALLLCGAGLTCVGFARKV